MKKFVLFMMSLAVVMTACDRGQREDVPIVRFESPIAQLGPEAPLNLKIVLSKAAESELVIQYSLGGTAVEDTDFSVAEDAFIVPAGGREATITITHLNPETATKTLNVSIQAAGGYRLGNVKECLVSVGARENIIWSFTQRTTTLTYGAETTIEVALTGEVNGSDWVAANPMSIPFEVMASSTATSSEYSFKDGAKAFTVAKGAKKATLTLVAGEFAEETPAKFIELTLVPTGTGFTEGDRSLIKIYLYHTPGLKDIVGTWEYASFILTDDPDADMFLLEMLTDPDWGGSGDDLELLPKHNTAADKFTISLVDGEYKLTPDMTGDVGNYFRPATISDETPVDYNFYYIDGSNYKSMECTLSSVNKLFSKTKEELGEAKFKFSLSSDGNTLNVFIYDYIPTDFLNIIYEMPDAYGTPHGIYLFMKDAFDMAYTFTRVAE